MNDHCDMAEHRAQLLHKFGLEGWPSRDHDIAIYTALTRYAARSPGKSVVFSV
jgi:hypothetical protein